VAEKGYRVFCGWSLFLGLASLPWIEESFKKDDPRIKIPRERTFELLARAEGALEENSRTVQLFELLTSLLPTSDARTDRPSVRSPMSVVGTPVSTWFETLALDEFLTPPDLKALGLA
jgi:hypothetical protein